MKKLFTLFVLLLSFIGLANAQNMIENVYVNGFTVPVWGELPDFDLEVPEGENYSIDFTVWYFDNGENSSFLSPDHAFEDEEWVYWMEIGLDAGENASFSPSVNVFINNSQTLVASTELAQNDKLLVVSSNSFTVANPATTISEIRVNGYTAPVMGEHPDFDLELMPGEARYYIDEVSWLWRTDDEDDELTPESVFDRDYGVYYMVVSFLANEGFHFVDNAQVYFNGDASVYNPEFSGTVGPVFYAYTIDYALGQSGTLSYGFEDGTLQDLQNVDADGDGHGWMPVNGSGHKSNGFVTSESYDAITSMALDPDNYLISPQVKLGGSIKFFACAENEYYPNEHFGVAVSTTGTDPENFTIIKEWTLSAKHGAWYECSADLSAYAGQTGYVAIRHYNSPDQYRLNIDDIQIVEGNGEVPPISEIRLNGYTAPVWGAHPDLDLTVPSDAHYSISDVAWVHDGYVLNVTPSTVYDQEGVYFMYVELTPDEGYAFAENATVYFNNDANICDAAYNELLGDGTFVTYTIDYQLTNPITTCTITASANPTAGGTVTGGGTYEKGDACTLSATAKEGYLFVNWTRNGSEVSTSATYSFIVTGSANFLANFVPTQTKLVTLTVQCDPDEGTVSGGGTYAAGTVVEVQAFPLKGYVFDRWSDNNTQNPRSITLNENMTLVAYFKNTGVGENDVTALKAYPNPANDIIHLEGLEANSEVQFYNSLGMLVKTVTANADEEVNISDLAPGMYMIRSGKQTLRFVKE